MFDCAFNILFRAKGFQHQRMTNGAMNVEIGNPAYGEPDDDAGELLDADFTLDPDKVVIKWQACLSRSVASDISFNGYLLSRSSPPTLQTRCMPLCTWELTTVATLWPAQMRRRSCYHAEMRSPLWTRWHRLSIGLDHAIPNTPHSCLLKKN